MASSDIQLSLDSSSQESASVSETNLEITDDSPDIETKCANNSNGDVEEYSMEKSVLDHDKNNFEWKKSEKSIFELNNCNISEELCVNGLNLTDSDGCGQNISNHPAHENSETCSVAGETQFQEVVHTNISQIYAPSCGSFHHSVPKVNYSHRVPSPNRYNSPQSCGTSPCHQVAGSINLNSVGNGQHIVLLHVNPGETISFHMGDHMQLIQGPATVPMVSSNTTPPIPMPVQVPPGHMVQQIVDENGTLRHIILSPQPPVAMPMGTPYNPGPNPGTTNTTAVAGASPFFVYPHPTFPLPTQFHPHMQSGLGSHGLHSPAGHLQPQPNSSHSHQGPPTTPSTSHINTHKDERTQRQFLKLKKRLEARQRDSFVLLPEATSTSRKDTVEEKSKDKSPLLEDLDQRNCSEEKSRLIEILSTIKLPVVKKITARSALIQWTHPDLNNEKYPDLHIDEADFLYKVFLSEKSKDARLKIIYSGSLLEYSLCDLKPASPYLVSIQCGVDEICGIVSDSVGFQTLPCEPDVPQQPKLISRTKTSLSLKWNATADNGSKILNYVLEYDEGKGEGNFVELFCGLQKQYKVNKLSASTCYKFRLAAVNEHGKSQFSDTSCFSTSGSTPSQPQPPTLKQAHVNKLTLMWGARPNDDDFTLQMEDEATCHGFLPVYNGKDTSYTCLDLRRNTEYKFRICANNEEGSSPWSQVVCFCTLPDRPAPPGKPYLKGRAHATNFKIAWEFPRDTGGSCITKYNAEMDDGNGFESVYCGLDTECQCDLLQPGTPYVFRVQCFSDGGSSLYSETHTIAALPVIPGKCHPPRLFGKPKALSLHLKWSYPDYNGGSEILEFEVELTNPDNSIRQVYRGTGTDCVVAGLQPGRQYKFKVRAYNKLGHGLWSDEVEIVSGAGTPDEPKYVQAYPRSSHSVVVSWDEPCNNGAAINEYCVESSQTEEELQIVYVGIQTSVEIKNLIPSTLYYFRVQAINSAGAGPFSSIINCLTLPSSPGSIPSSNIKAICGATTIALSWKEPINNGAAIINYNIEVGDSVCVTEDDCPQICIEGLAPECTYKIRIQAVNSIGLGPFSSSVKVMTRGLPPCPPTLECCGHGYNSLRLKWGDGKNPDFIQYVLEMENHLTKSFTPVYQGTSHCHKVSKLQETTSYNFRIYASNDEGDGSYSPVYTFTTLKALPPALRAPKASSITETSCIVDWQTTKSFGDDSVSYKLTMSCKESDYQMVYAGTNTSFTIHELQPSTDYSVRVVALRHCSDGTGDLPGPLSPSTTFCTAHPASTKSNSPKVVSAVASLADRQPLTDQQWAIIILCGFTLFAILVAILIEWILSYSRS